MVMLWMLSTLVGFGSRSSGRVADRRWSCCTASWVTGRHWGYQLEALSDAFTGIAWDGPGAGHSSAVPESFRLADYAECLSGFLRALDLAHPYVAGCCSALYWR
jgi:hypothetical protein